MSHGGSASTDSVVTVTGIAQFHNIVEFVATEPVEIRAVLADNLAVPGTNNISYGGEPALALRPEHTRILGRIVPLRRGRPSLRARAARPPGLTARRPGHAVLAPAVMVRPRGLADLRSAGGSVDLRLRRTRYAQPLASSFGPTAAISRQVDL